MLVIADGTQSCAFAVLRGRTDVVLLSDICETPEQALALKREIVKQHPERGEPRVVRVLLTVTELS